MPQLTVVRDVRPSRTVLSVRGELDLGTAEILRAAVHDALAGPGGALVLDMSGTDFIDSAGSRELLRAAKAGASSGVSVVVVVPRANRQVRFVLEFMEFGDVLPLHESMPPE